LLSKNQGGQLATNVLLAAATFIGLDIEVGLKFVKQDFFYWQILSSGRPPKSVSVQNRKMDFLSWKEKKLF
jgi:hypothetical protein